MKYTTINIQGNLISEEILQKIEQGNADGQSPKDFGYDSPAILRNEIEYAWSRIKLDWKHFNDKSQQLAANDPYGTTLTRKWMEGFFDSLGFDLVRKRNALEGGNNQLYAISSTAENLDDLPVHIVGFVDPSNGNKNTLDIKSSGGTSRLSPHATVQEYLNVTEYIYGIAANGLYLRLIRDSGRLVKLTCVEFDLKRMLDDDKYSEFTVLYRLLHASRFPANRQDSEKCWLEKYYQDSIETGNRIRDGLSNAVKESLIALGKGFLQHENNTALRQKLLQGTLTPKDFYRQLLRLIYRLLFLMVTEERDLVYNPDIKDEELLRKKRIYLQFYSIARLRELSENRYLYEKQFNDLWQGLVNTFQLFEAHGKGKKLGILPLDGDLFNETAIQDIETSFISNELLLECIRNLNEFTDDNKNLVPINYRSLDVEELGSVYEGLLELHQVIENIEAPNPAHINFTFHEGTERKTTGSYYTRPELVNELIKSALIPVIEERLNLHKGNKEAQRKTLLALKVCDAAAGSGHMLLAAARTIAWYMARVQSGEDNPAPSVYRVCLREVIQHCVYGVDMNPDAVELCKLAMWLESHDCGKPLSFLDHKIRCGNSLVGVTDLSVLSKGIPDEAYNPVTGDDKEVCKELRKANAAFNKTKQISLFDQQATKNEAHEFSDEYYELENIQQDNVEAVHKAKKKFEQLRSNVKWWKDWRACNLWTAAFFFEYTEENKQSAPTSERLQKFLQNPEAAYAPMVGKANAMSIEHKFFHWSLEFPDVFEQGGFDVMLGNPPWESVQLEEKQYFLTKAPHITLLKGAERKKAIQELKGGEIFKDFVLEKHLMDSQVRFIKYSNRFVLTAKNKINTYTSFAELTACIINPKGRTGIIIPTGISTDESASDYFSYLMANKQVVSLIGFENEEFIFPGIANVVRFCLFTIKGILGKESEPTFAYHLRNISQLGEEERFFKLSKKEIELFNPKTKTSPIFRTKSDKILNTKFYEENQILSKLTEIGDVLKIRLFQGLYNITSDSKLFVKKRDLNCLPLYESKYIWHYDHRFGSFDLKDKLKGKGGRGLPDMPIENLKNPDYIITPMYYVPIDETKKRIPNTWKNSWLIIYRRIANFKLERTMTSAIIPLAGVGDSSNLIFSESRSVFELLLLYSNFNSIIYDYTIRQKVAGSNLSQFFILQTPILEISKYSNRNKLEILHRQYELSYTSWDIKAFADDVWKEASLMNNEEWIIKNEEWEGKTHTGLQAAIVKQWKDNKAATGGHEWNPPDWFEIDEKGCPLPPFKWDEHRRAVLKAELDAIYAKLYGLTTEELRYILDPQDVYGPEFPGETFRVLKEKEIRQFGEYRTRRLVLEAWERLNKESSIGN
jgi:hypothetical protein